MSTETTTEWGVRWRDHHNVTTTVRRYSEQAAREFAKMLPARDKPTLMSRTVSRSEWVEVPDA